MAKHLDSLQHENVKEDLKKRYYEGSIHCDGYEAYHKLEKARIIGCMAHARRKFVEAMEANALHKQAKN